MKMNYAELESKGLIHSYKASLKQIQEQIKLAERDIRTAKKMLAEDADWSFSIAYNAILQAGRALMFFRGYRPTSGEGAHVAVVQFAEITLGKAMRNEVDLFDRMRKKRHQAIYDQAGLISQEEARQSCAFAQEFVNAVKKTIADKNMNLFNGKNGKPS